MNSPPLVFSVAQSGKERQDSPTRHSGALALISSDNNGFAIGTIAMSSSASKVALTRNDNTPAPSRDRQGADSVPLAKSRVVITGIVTARKSSGVFLQSPGHVADNQAATSEGIFVHMSSTPPTPVNRVVTPSLPGTLRSPLTNLVNLLWSGERYCHGLDGTAQVLDQMLL